MNNNYKIIRTIFENVYQRVLECKDNDTGEVFYNNVITSQKIIGLINIDGLTGLNSNILNCYKTDDRIFIITRALESEGRSLKEYVISNNLSLKQQFSLSKKIIELSSNIFNLTDVVQQKILDLNKIYVDENDDVVVDCNLIFEQEFDIRDNETFKRMGNMLHYIFSSSEIVDYNISELIPPDMLKIIVRCLTKEYMYPSDALKELVNSPIYNMINSSNSKENQVKANIIPPFSKKEDKHDTYNKETDLNIKETDLYKTQGNEMIKDEENFESFENLKSDESILNLYLNDNNSYDDNDMKEKKFKKNIKGYFSHKDINRAVISLIIIMFVLIFGNFLMDKFDKDAEGVSSDNTNIIKLSENGVLNNGDIENADGSFPVEGADSKSTDSTSKFFNEALIKKVGYTGTVAESDSDIYVEGEKSLVVKNEVDEKVKALFATIDFTDQNYSYMLKKQIGVSVKTKSESDLSSLIVLEAYKDGKLASTFHTTIQIYNDMWAQNMVPINVTNADSLNIYIEYSGKNKVWIDSIYIDVVK